jgi:uncharacterized protein (TIGR00369 family)
MIPQVQLAPRPGFEDAPLDEGFLDSIGPLYAKREADGTFVLAFRATPGHANRQGSVHGGMLATLADTAIGMNLARVTPNIETTLTLTLAMDYIGVAAAGDWVEARVTLTKVAGRVRFGDCEITVEGRVVARGHAVFYVPRPGV